MKIEGYLFIPYQGQVRFRYDSSAHMVFHKSDGAYDKVLGVHALTGSRHGTCTELVYRGDRTQNDLKKYINRSLGQIIPQFNSSKIGALMKIELGDGPTQLPKDKNNPVKITLTVLLVDK